ncbi:hypothetical protein Z946_2091 [Sulfitobacter noctilucicola]|uniref:Uncharacterized protein n=1 Tax=Sulfitobacter noctilucicola TaxID=1342301 RepID=A0A7W6M4L5_9RHOB|nr:hypothetical protein [Sulfitobacter noctilucicola]KIN63227.1 hypothetical protein Z946_2091 [Sulfitobacter noctilucicola]MBB4172246.1 hypothetical protein [Sulfitobacter noctilucicola]
MQIKTVAALDVRYNAGSGMFEALVSLQTDDGIFRYPCMFDGNINVPISIAAHRLTQQAKSRHEARSDLRAFRKYAKTAPHSGNGSLAA